jgi:multisubunit Na+/H+ antiporter MnhE subunit
MLHAAALLAGLSIIWLIAAPHGQLSQDVPIALAAALVCVGLSSRFGGIAPSAFARAPQFILLAISRAGAVMRGTLSTIRAAIAADVTLKPALVRVRTRASAPFSKAALADLISATPGMVVVETDAEGMLVHVIDEDGVDAAGLGRLEAHVLAATGGEVRS